MYIRISIGKLAVEESAKQIVYEKKIKSVVKTIQKFNYTVAIEILVVIMRNQLYNLQHFQSKGRTSFL